MGRASGSSGRGGEAERDDVELEMRWCEGSAVEQVMDELGEGSGEGRECSETEARVSASWSRGVACDGGGARVLMRSIVGSSSGLSSRIGGHSLEQANEEGTAR